MKYTIVINQKAWYDSGLEVDIIDLSIFDFLHIFSHSPSCRQYFNQEEKATYYMFSWKLIVQQLPLLGLNTRQAVYKRMKRLEAAGIIIPEADNQINGTAYYKFGPNYEKLHFDYSLETDAPQPVNAPPQKPVNGTVHNKDNKNTDNTIKDNIEETVKKKKEVFIEMLVNWEKLHPYKYPKIMYRNFFSYWVEVSATKKIVKLRYEAQQFFDVGRRLSTWFSHCNDRDILAQRDADVKLPELKIILLNVVHGQ